MSRVFSKVMWVGRVTTFCVGLAVVLALVLGVGTAALAAVPGDPFKLGRMNYVGQLTTVAGALDGAILRVDNDGYGPALDLRVGDTDTLPENEPAPPMRVDSQARVANLNADELDGKSARDFLGAGARARDAGMLDGLNSTQFMRAPGYASWVKSDADSTTRKTIIAPCPPEHVPIGGGARVTAVSGSDNGEMPVALTVSEAAGSSGWRAEAQEMAPFEGDWYVLAEPVCVPSQGEIAILDGEGQ